jgi:hypothetical protein
MAGKSVVGELYYDPETLQVIEVRAASDECLVCDVKLVLTRAEFERRFRLLDGEPCREGSA